MLVVILPTAGEFYAAQRATLVVGFATSSREQTAYAGVLRNAVRFFEEGASVYCGSIILSLEKSRNVGRGKVANLASGASAKLKVEVSTVGATERHALGRVGVSKRAGACSRRALICRESRFKIAG